jgi:enoyl-CoA hydratase
MRRGKELSLAEALKLEYRIASHLVTRPDYAEGIRVRIAERDRSPRWQPARLEEVRAEDIDSLFGPAADGELELQEFAFGDAG